MKAFLARHARKIIGVLSGFDRLVFRGTLRQISHVAGLQAFLAFRRILYKDFGAYVEKTTAQVRSASEEVALTLKRPVRYLASSGACKEDVALALLEANPIKEGLICVLSCVELCQSFDIHRSKQKKRLELVTRIRNCLHLYHYFLDPEFGLFHVRLQTWFPFAMQVCINGRHWLANQMERSGIANRRSDNCFPWIEDFDQAQKLMDGLLRTNWTKTLGEIANRVNPAYREIFAGATMPYYWSVHQCEWATDVGFADPPSLSSIYRPLVLHAISQFNSKDVMRFLGQNLTPTFKGEVVSDFKGRPEGIRVKHRVRENSIKIYDKQGSVLRVETTINHPRSLRVYRRREGHPKEKPAWRGLRKGVADLHRLAKLSQDSNNRYLDALSVVEDSTELRDLTREVCRHVSYRGRRYRPLRPWDESEAKLLEAVQRGEFVITGFRNRDIRCILFPGKNATPKETRKRSARVTRLLALLRAHKLIQKIRTTNRYQVTQEGRRIITAILAARNASVAKLVNAA